MAKNICRFMFTNEEIPEPQDDKENFFWSNIKDVLKDVKRIEECGRKPKNLNEKMPHFMFMETSYKAIKLMTDAESGQYICTTCGESYIENVGNQYEKVTSYIEYLFNLYSPYMIWVFLGTSGVWSVAMGVAMIIARKNEEKEKAKRMLVNYGIGLIVIFSILIACPYLVRGIAALIT